MQEAGRAKVPQTVTDMVFEDLRQRIINGELAPGMKLKHAELAKQLATSPTPVREALTRLELVGLADYSPRRGWYVHEITHREAQQLYEVREYVEGLVARRLAADSSAQRLSHPTQALRRFDASLSRGDTSGCVAADLDFHRQLAYLAGNLFAVEIIDRLFDRVYILRRQDNDLDSLREAVAEHRRIVTAIRRRKPEEAEAAARQHVRGCQDFLARLFNRE